MDPFTPKALFDLYRMLPREQQDDFLKRIAQISTAREPLIIFQHLPPMEQLAYSNHTNAWAFNELMPMMAKEAVRLARSNPDLSDKELSEQVDAKVRSTLQTIADEAGLLHRAELKQQRDRKPDKQRLERGRIISDANKNGVSWREMPTYILSTYPDWFPQASSMSSAQLDALRETLRRMARDANK